jgi:hypothetical protein
MDSAVWRSLAFSAAGWLGSDSDIVCKDTISPEFYGMHIIENTKGHFNIGGKKQNVRISRRITDSLYYPRFRNWGMDARCRTFGAHFYANDIPRPYGRGYSLPALRAW